MTVARRDLELVAPDHPLSPEADASLASWWLEQLEPWGRGVPVGSLVPSGLESVCQVLHPWWGPDDEPVRWRTLSEHPDIAELRERYQSNDSLVQDRGHLLLRGPLTGVLDPVSESGSDGPVSGLWWPADRAWFVATEIDFEWTFVAGASSLVDRLISDDRLEAMPTTFDAPANRAAPGDA